VADIRLAAELTSSRIEAQSISPAAELALHRHLGHIKKSLIDIDTDTDNPHTSQMTSTAHLLINDLVQRGLVVTVFVVSPARHAYNKLVCVFNLSVFTELRRTETALRYYDKHLLHGPLQQLRTSCQRFLYQSLLKLYSSN